MFKWERFEFVGNKAKRVDSGLINTKSWKSAKQQADELMHESLVGLTWDAVSTGFARHHIRDNRDHAFALRKL